nr:MAG TPA: hypothetical protein [Caudoviricetes sp.]
MDFVLCKKAWLMSHAFIICNHFNLLFFVPREDLQPIVLRGLTTLHSVDCFRSSGFATPKLILSGF